jgi:hypothetical protein
MESSPSDNPGGMRPSRPGLSIMPGGNSVRLSTWPSAEVSDVKHTVLIGDDAARQGQTRAGDLKGPGKRYGSRSSNLNASSAMYRVD